MLHPTPALFSWLAQAGGGGSFGSGGGGAGGGGGDGGGGGGDGEAFLLVVRLLMWAMQLTVEHPLIGVPCWVVGLALVGVGLRRGWFEHQERGIWRARPRRAARSSALALARIAGADGAFDGQRFLARVELAFRRAQEGWCAQDLERLRPFVSDGVLERFALQLDEQRADGWRQGMDGLVLGPLSVLHFAQGPVFEAVSVQVPFQARIDRRALADGRRLPGSELPERHFSEVWTFLRRRGTPSLAGEGLLEGKCPGCAAPLALNRSARCAHCGAHVKNGRFDWVLCELTQRSVWAPEDEARLPGFTALQVRDVGLSAAALEDRASVVFWRLAAAERARSSAPLAALADEAVRAELEPLLARGPILTERAVGSVRTLGFLTCADGEHVLLEVLWDGRAPGAQGSARRLRRTLIVLRRATGAHSDADLALTTAHCRTCGAHDDGALTPLCAYCGTARLVPVEDWRLVAAPSAGDPVAVRWLGELRAAHDGAPVSSPPAPRDLLRWSAVLAWADGKLEPREARALEALAQALGLEAAELLAGPVVLEPGSLRRPASTQEGREWFRTLVRIALADTKLTSQERAFLARTSRRLGFAPGAFRRELEAARLELWRESRATR